MFIVYVMSRYVDIDHDVVVSESSYARSLELISRASTCSTEKAVYDVLEPSWWPKIQPPSIRTKKDTESEIHKGSIESTIDNRHRHRPRTAAAVWWIVVVIVPILSNSNSPPCVVSTNQSTPHHLSIKNTRRESTMMSRRCGYAAAATALLALSGVSSFGEFIHTYTYANI